MFLLFLKLIIYMDFVMLYFYYNIYCIDKYYLNVDIKINKKSFLNIKDVGV